MSEELDKLMKKMKSNKAEETPEPVKEDVKKLEEVKASDEEIKKAVVDAPEEIDDDEDDEDDEVEIPELEKPEGLEDDEASDPIPATEDNPEHTVEAEIGILQNDGIFRHEMLLIEKEKVDVLKVIAQTLLDFKKKFEGDDDAK